MEMKKEQLDSKYILWPREKVEEVIGLKRTALYAAIKNDGFPKPLRIGGRASRWRKSDVLEWIDSRPQELEA